MQKTFLGMYARRKEQEESEPDQTGWRVWKTADGVFLAQPYSQEGLALADPTRIEDDDFFVYFQPIQVKPADDQADAEPVCLPDDKVEAVLEKSRAGRADDPDLLKHWLKAGPAQAPADPEPASPAKADEAPPGAEAAGDEVKNPSQSEHELRAEYALALIKLQSDKAATRDLRKILTRPLPPLPEYKFMFTEFGKSLRKKGLCDLACLAHERALEMDPDDEHVLFNLSRALHGAGKTEEALGHLKKALAINPAFGLAKEFLGFLEK